MHLLRNTRTKIVFTTQELEREHDWPVIKGQAEAFHVPFSGNWHNEPNQFATPSISDTLSSVTYFMHFLPIFFVRYLLFFSLLSLPFLLFYYLLSSIFYLLIFLSNYFSSFHFTCLKFFPSFTLFIHTDSRLFSFCSSRSLSLPTYFSLFVSPSLSLYLIYSLTFFLSSSFRTSIPQSTSLFLWK